MGHSISSVCYEPMSLGVRLIIDFVDLVFYLIHIESWVHLICDYGLTGDSDCMERMSLNFVWILRLTWNCCKR